MGREIDDELMRAELARAERIAELWDSAFEVPVIGTRVGVDAILGLVPGLGDLVGLLPALLHQAAAKRLGAPLRTRAGMALRSLLDLAVGAIPVVGDLADVWLKANVRNAAALRRHVERLR